MPGFLKKKFVKPVTRASLVFFSVCAILYLFLFGMQVYSVWQASRVLDRVEKLRAGDPYTAFQSAIRGCEIIESTNAGSYYHLVAGAFRFDLPWRALHGISDSVLNTVVTGLRHVGLRYWDVRISAEAADGRVTNVSMGSRAV